MRVRSSCSAACPAFGGDRVGDSDLSNRCAVVSHRCFNETCDAFSDAICDVGHLLMD